MREPQLMGASWHQDSFDIAYLATAGIEREKPDLEFLEPLNRALLETFPFANVDILLGRDTRCGTGEYPAANGGPQTGRLLLRTLPVVRCRGGGFRLHRDCELRHVTDVSRIQPADVGSGHLMTSTRTVSGPFTRALIVSRFTSDGHVTVTFGTRTGQPTKQESITTAEVVESVRELGVSISGEEQSRLLHVLDGWVPTVAERPRLPRNQRTDTGGA